MYKIIVCAEDLFIRLGIAHSLFWEKYGYSIIGTVANEDELYNEVIMSNADIVIVDIDTLHSSVQSLCQILKDFKGEIECIGVGQAREDDAIREYIEDGLLGYISRQDLTYDKLLMNIHEYRDILRVKMKARIPTDTRINKALITAAKSNSLKELLYASKSTGIEWHKEMLHRYNLHLEQPNYSVIMAKLRKDETEQDEIQTMRITESDEIETRVGSATVYTCHSGVGEVSFICNFNADGEGSQESMIRDITQKIMDDLLVVKGTKPTLYISQVYDTLKGIHAGYVQCIETYEKHKNYDPKVPFVFCEDKQSITYNRYVAMMKEYIEMYYMEEMSMSVLAEEVGLTVSYMSTLFKRSTGQTYKDYLIFCRLEKAKEKLSQTTESIRVIANKIGYENEHYFSKLFKEKIGMTPSEYRNQYYIRRS